MANVNITAQVASVIHSTSARLDSSISPIHVKGTDLFLLIRGIQNGPLNLRLVCSNEVLVSDG